MICIYILSIFIIIIISFLIGAAFAIQNILEDVALGDAKTLLRIKEIKKQKKWKK